MAMAVTVKVCRVTTLTILAARRTRRRTLQRACRSTVTDRTACIVYVRRYRRAAAVCCMTAFAQTHRTQGMCRCMVVTVKVAAVTIRAVRSRTLACRRTLQRAVIGRIVTGRTRIRCMNLATTVKRCCRCTVTVQTQSDCVQTVAVAVTGKVAAVTGRTDVRVAETAILIRVTRCRTLQRDRGLRLIVTRRTAVCGMNAGQNSCTMTGRRAQTLSRYKAGAAMIVDVRYRLICMTIQTSYRIRCAALGDYILN